MGKKKRLKKRRLLKRRLRPKKNQNPNRNQKKRMTSWRKKRKRPAKKSPPNQDFPFRGSLRRDFPKVSSLTSTTSHASDARKISSSCSRSSPSTLSSAKKTRTS